MSFLGYFILNADYHRFFQVGDDLARDYIRSLLDFYDWLVSYEITLGDSSFYLIETMIGGGIIVYCGYQFLKWVIDVT